MEDQNGKNGEVVAVAKTKKKGRRGNHVNSHQMILIGTSSCPIMEDLKKSLVQIFHRNNELIEPQFQAITRKDFSNGEFHSHVSESVRDADVYVVAQPRNEQHIIDSDMAELRQVIRSCREGQASKVNVIIPSLPYARQDRASREREFPALRLVIDELVVAGLDTLTVFEIHNSATTGYMVGMEACSTLNFIVKKVKKYLIGDDHENFCLIAPDIGSAKFIDSVRQKFLDEGIDLPTTIIQKHRDPQTGETRITGVAGGHRNKGIMIDDMIDTGGTAAKASLYLKGRGMQEVHLVGTHGIFSKGAAEKLASGGFTSISVTDTCPIPDEVRRLPGFRIWTISNFLAGIIDNMHNGKSNTEYLRNGGLD